MKTLKKKKKKSLPNKEYLFYESYFIIYYYGSLSFTVSVCNIFVYNLTMAFFNYIMLKYDSINEIKRYFKNIYHICQSSTKRHYWSNFKYMYYIFFFLVVVPNKKFYKTVKLWCPSLFHFSRKKEQNCWNLWFIPHTYIYTCYTKIST